MVGWMDGWINGWMDGWINGWVDGWTDGWTDGRMDGHSYINILLDPQVKIAGPLESVNKARDILLSDLDTKTNRVTLKINVAFGEHSHVIGREGANIRKGT